MRHELRNIVPSRRQRFYAWMMLLVYLPMVLLSSVHVHQLQENSQSVDCYECHAGNHHAGHITDGSGHHDNCLSCRFLSTQVIAPDQQVLSNANRPAVKLEQSHATPACARPVANPSQRAPPVVV